MEEFSKKGIQTVVWITPILPFINDTEENIRQLLSMCADVNVYGIISFGMGVTLREGSREYFYEQLDRWFPGLKHKYIKKYGEVYELKSDNNDRLVNILQEECQRYGIICNNSEIFENLFKYENKKFQQLDLFDL